MPSWVEWALNNWLQIVIPVIALLATYVVGLWLRRLAYEAFDRWLPKARWRGSRLIVQVTRRPFMHWVWLLGFVIAIQISVLPQEIKSLAVRVIGSLFVLSLGWTVIVLAEHLLRLYLPKSKVPGPVAVTIVNVVRIYIIFVGVVIILDIWGVPTTHFYLLIAVAILAAVLALRNVAPNLFAGFQINAGQQIKVGDYIKLETGEEGYVIETNWTNTHLEGLDESTVIIPNGRLLQHTIINYGRPLKKAKEPFHFNSRIHLPELTGLRAKNLQELAATLKEVPDAVVYYHTHHFLEEYHYLTPELSNDFAIWTNDALGDEMLGERLASVDVFSFPNLGALRQRLVAIVEEHMARGTAFREALDGREFYFVKSVSLILPTPYVVHDLREFVEALRKTSLGSLYFHVFESRLRLSRGLNDFSIWLDDSLGESELAGEIARLDPYTYTLEGLRSVLIHLIEKRIQ